MNGLAVSGGDFSSDADAPDAILLPAGGSTTIVSNLEGSNADRDFITVEIPDGYRLADVLLDNYVADPGNSGFLGLKLGDDLTLDPAVPQLGQSPDGVVEPGDLNGGLVFNEGFVGNDLLSALNDTSSGFAGFESGWRCQPDDADFCDRSDPRNRWADRCGNQCRWTGFDAGRHRLFG